MKKTRRSLNTILNGQSSGEKIEKIQHNGNVITDPSDISNVFKTFFTNIGPETQQKIPEVYSVNHKCYLGEPLTNSLFLQPVTSNDVF